MKPHNNSALSLILSPIRTLVICSALIIGLSACGSSKLPTSPELISVAKQDTQYLRSGTIILSRQMPQQSNEVQALLSPENQQSGWQQAIPFETAPKTFAPLIGYFPPVSGYAPADNETWLEVDRQSKKLTLFKGKSPLKVFVAEGNIDIGPGDFYLQHKQKEPLWYAPDEYFEHRKLATPKPGDRLRYRRGALGRYALYPTTTFPIHCGAVWSPDVGGLKVSSSDLASIYYMLPLGAPIVVR
jgi:hypothetical protein